MKQFRIYSIVATVSLVACSSFLLVSCSERKPAGSDKPKTKVKTVKDTDLEMFKNEKKKKKEEKTEMTPAKPESESETKPSEETE